MNTFDQELTSKTRTNAMISYFFLGWIFLLARNNPDFAHPFIRSHAKKATKIHVLLLGGFTLYSLYLAKYIPNFSIPIVPTLTLDKIISVIFFVILAFSIVRGAYSAQKWESSEEVSSTKLKDAFKRENIELGATSESDKAIFLSSYIPLLGIITAHRYRNPITQMGEKVSSIWLFVTLFLSALGGYSEVIWVLLFAYILLVAFVGVSLFVQNIIPGFALMEKIPDIDTVYTFVRAIFPYTWKFLRVIFGKQESLNFHDVMEKIRQKDMTHTELAQAHFTDTTLPFPKSLIFVPIINLIFIPQIFLRKNGAYILAILQGMVMTIILVAIWFFIDFSSLWQTFLLFAIFLGMAQVEKNPFYKIPFVYETYIVLDFFAFGIGGKVQKLKEKHKEAGDKVSFKI